MRESTEVTLGNGTRTHRKAAHVPGGSASDASRANRAFDPRLTGRQSYVNDRDSGAFVPLDPAIFHRIRSGLIRL